MNNKYIPILCAAIIFIFSGCFAQIDSFVFLTPVNEETLKVDLNFIFWFWGEGKKKTQKKDMKADFEELKKNLDKHGAKVTKFDLFDHSYGQDKVSRTQLNLEFEVSNKKEIPIQLMVSPEKNKEKTNFFGLPALKYTSDKIVFTFPEEESLPENVNMDDPQSKQKIQMQQMAKNVISSLFSLTLAFPQTVNPEKVTLVVNEEKGTTREDLPVIKMGSLNIVKIPSMALISVLKKGYVIEVELGKPEKKN